MKKRLSKSLRKFIRREKARLRGEFSGAESDQKIRELMSKLNPAFGQKEPAPQKPEARKVSEKKASKKEPKKDLKSKPKPAAAAKPKLRPKKGK
jgi:hypothetical protein